MKKIVLVLMLTAVAAQASPINPLKEFGPAPVAPAKSGGLFGKDMFGGLFGQGGAGAVAGGMGSAMTGIPPVNVGLGVGITKTEQKQNLSQTITATGGDNSSVQAQIQAGQTGIQTATPTTSASGMGGR